MGCANNKGPAGVPGGVKNVFVTGGNSGIGLALCKQLAADDGCFVFMGSRDLEKGKTALESISQGLEGKIEVVQCDISKPDSVNAAAELVKSKAKGPLYALVNNAGCGLSHGVPADEINDVNLYGTKTMVDAFLPMIQEGGRIINVGSGAGPSWLGQQDDEMKALVTSGNLSKNWNAIDFFVRDNRNQDAMHAYGLSKCMLSVYTELLANTNPKIMSSSITPGFIETSITKGMGATKKPEEGTVAIRHCLFNQLQGNGWFYGSDAIRSPLWPMRSPGQAPFTGEYPWSPEQGGS
jgi:NAD(P)-dependent dehydrogenase (short-subunit alcohol dehydrogenase family)